MPVNRETARIPVPIVPPLPMGSAPKLIPVAFMPVENWMALDQPFLSDWRVLDLLRQTEIVQFLRENDKMFLSFHSEKMWKATFSDPDPGKKQREILWSLGIAAWNTYVFCVFATE